MNQTINTLKKGFSHFKSHYQEHMEALAQEQAPYAMIVTCCDSRVAPELLFQSKPGELFVIRNVANVVPPYEKDGKHHGTSAALEFGIRFLKLEHLIILGHSNCAGIRALVNNSLEGKDEFISSWVSLLQKENQGQFSVDDYALEGLNISYEHCLQFPWIKSCIDQNKLRIDRLFFNIEKGTLSAFNKETNIYEIIT